jgi:8-oxo-dGTP pyrophosphatase MutT (NUDIX family)
VPLGEVGSFAASPGVAGVGCGLRPFRGDTEGPNAELLPRSRRAEAERAPAVGVTAIERGDEFLVERRVDDAEVWAFVGGTLEEDEQILDALHREVHEGTGFEIENAPLLGLFSVSDPTRIVAYSDGSVCRVLSAAFRVAPCGDAEPIRTGEWAGMEFASREDVAVRPFRPAQRPIRDALLNEPHEIVVE